MAAERATVCIKGKTRDSRADRRLGRVYEGSRA
jgi:hypothetical protein